MATTEFQAVILAAGRGTRLPELLNNEQPKCLLPIGAYPLLWYPLHTLQIHGFQEAIVVVLENQKNQIQQAIEKTSLQLKIDYVMIQNDSDWGTADSLRYISDKIKSDLIVMSCDVLTNVSLYPLINKFREHNATVTALLFNNFETISMANMPGPKNKFRFERDLIGLQEDTQRLLFLASTSDFEETLELNGHLLRKYKKFNIFSRLIDSHIYVMKKWLVDFLKKKESISAIKGEFLPYIVKKQMSKNYSSSIEAQSEVGVNVKYDEDIFKYVPFSNLEKKIIKSSLYNESRIKEPYDGDLIRCYAIKTPDKCIGVRINTTVNYYTINMKIFSIWDDLIWNKNIPLISPNAIIKSTQTKDISVADGVMLSEKTSLKSSVFGQNCCINPKVKITNSIIMSNVIVEEGCDIENSIICNRAVIKSGTCLINCIVGPNFTTEEGGIKKQNTHLTNADGFMEIE